MVAGRSAEEQVGKTNVDPASWRLIELYADVVYADGTPDSFQIETLQPPEWVAEHKAEVGAEVPVPLDVVELGLPEGFKATVVANEPCPPIKPGPGRVVLSTVNHLSFDVYELTVQSRAGQIETVRPTGSHQFYLPNENEWVATEDLEIGDTLSGVAGPITVRRVEPISGPHRVYNLTVEDDHVYRVSLLGALVHNNGRAWCPNPNGKLGSPAHQAKIAQVEQDIRARGLTPQREVPIRSVNGKKKTRVADIVARDSTDKIVEVHQVGNGLKSKPLKPIARERDAFRDIRFSPDAMGAKRIFHTF